MGALREQALAHEKAAKVVALKLARDVYPELRAASRLGELSELWIELPINESHATRFVDLA